MANAESVMAGMAFGLKEKLESVLQEDMPNLYTALHRSNLSQSEIDWIYRVGANLERWVLPSLDNLDQVRWTFDKEKGGEGRPRELEDLDSQQLLD